MAWVSRRVFVPLVGVIALGSILSACSSGTANADAPDQNAFVTIDTASGPFVTIENLTSEALIDINIALKAGMLTFSNTIGRLEPKEKRQIRHGDFSSRDGTSFTLRITKPREVAVTARNVGGKQFESAQRWQ